MADYYLSVVGLDPCQCAGFCPFTPIRVLYSGTAPPTVGAIVLYSDNNDPFNVTIHCGEVCDSSSSSSECQDICDDSFGPGCNESSFYTVISVHSTCASCMNDCSSDPLCVLCTCDTTTTTTTTAAPGFTCNNIGFSIISPAPPALPNGPVTSVWQNTGSQTQSLWDTPSIFKFTVSAGAGAGQIHYFNSCDNGTYGQPGDLDGGSGNGGFHNFDIWMCIHDSSGNLIDSNDDACGDSTGYGSIATSDPNGLAAGDYYLTVVGYSLTGGTGNDIFPATYQVAFKYGGSTTTTAAPTTTTTTTTTSGATTAAPTTTTEPCSPHGPLDTCWGCYRAWNIELPNASGYYGYFWGDSSGIAASGDTIQYECEQLALVNWPTIGQPGGGANGGTIPWSIFSQVCCQASFHCGTVPTTTPCPTTTPTPSPCGPAFSGAVFKFLGDPDCCECDEIVSPCDPCCVTTTTTTTAIPTTCPGCVDVAGFSGVANGTLNGTYTRGSSLHYGKPYWEKNTNGTGFYTAHIYYNPANSRWELSYASFWDNSAGVAWWATQDSDQACPFTSLDNWTSSNNIGGNPILTSNLGCVTTTTTTTTTANPCTWGGSGVPGVGSGAGGYWGTGDKYDFYKGTVCWFDSTPLGDPPLAIGDIIKFQPAGFHHGHITVNAPANGSAVPVAFGSSNAYLENCSCEPTPMVAGQPTLPNKWIGNPLACDLLPGGSWCPCPETTTTTSLPCPNDQPGAMIADYYNFVSYLGDDVLGPGQGDRVCADCDNNGTKEAYRCLVSILMKNNPNPSEDPCVANSTYWVSDPLYDPCCGGGGGGGGGGTTTTTTTGCCGTGLGGYNYVLFPCNGTNVNDTVNPGAYIIVCVPNWLGVGPTAWVTYEECDGSNPWAGQLQGTSNENADFIATDLCGAGDYCECAGYAGL